MSVDNKAGLPADSFPKASFDDLEFAYSEVTVKGGIRYTIHEFPHAAGGEPEKMGRKPYVISFRAFFEDMPGSDLQREYPDAYPNGMRILREKCEIQLTAALVVPTIGTIRAVCTDWVQRFDARSPTGESFDLEFLEDQLSAFLISSAGGGAAGAQVVAEASDALLAAAALADFKSQTALGVFQQINDAVTAVQGAIDQGDAYAQLVAGKIEAVVNLCSYADSTLTEMQNPTNHVVVDALKDLWLASKEMAATLVDTSQTLLTYVVPRKMTIGQVSTVLYGSSDRGGDILQINAIEDALAIPAGTALRYVGTRKV